ncbi:hypothetical protein YC2023_077672 [Brassica napus]
MPQANISSSIEVLPDFTSSFYLRVLLQLFWSCEERWCSLIAIPHPSVTFGTILEVVTPTEKFQFSAASTFSWTERSKSAIKFPKSMVSVTLTKFGIFYGNLPYGKIWMITDYLQNYWCNSECQTFHFSIFD